MMVTGAIVRIDRRRRLVHARLPVDGSEEIEDAIYRHLESTTWEGGRLVESFVLTREKAEILSLPVSSYWWLGLALQSGEWLKFEGGELNGVRVEIEDSP